MVVSFHVPTIGIWGSGDVEVAHSRFNDRRRKDGSFTIAGDRTWPPKPRVASKLSCVHNQLPKRIPCIPPQTPTLSKPKQANLHLAEMPKLGGRKSNYQWSSISVDEASILFLSIWNQRLELALGVSSQDNWLCKWKDEYLSRTNDRHWDFNSIPKEISTAILLLTWQEILLR